MRADKYGLRFRPQSLKKAPKFIVSFGKQDIFYISDYKIQPDGMIFATWPAQIQKYLNGRSKVSVRDAATNQILGSTHARFGSSLKTISIEDSDGHPLFLTKWGRMGHALGQDETAKQKLILYTKKILQEVSDLGYNVAIASATLLASLRNNGKILRGDDDSDFVVYFKTNSPSEVVLQMLQLKRDLENLGYISILETGSQVTVLCPSPNGTMDFYIDFFAGFYKDGFYNQPIMLRQKAPKGEILPLKKVLWEDAYLPAPNRPELLMEQTYGKNWMIPDPGYQHIFPLSAVRYFARWFGKNIDLPREFFENLASSSGFEHEITDGNSLQMQFITQYFPKGSNVLDIGFGNANFTNEIQETGYNILGIDFSLVATNKAQRKYPNLNLQRLNILNWQDNIDFFTDLLATDANWNVNISGGLHQFTKEARFEIFTMLSRVLGAESTAIISFDTEYSKPVFSGQNPLSWYITQEMFDEEFHNFPNLEIVQTAEQTREVPNIGIREFQIVIIKRKL